VDNKIDKFLDFTEADIFNNIHRISYSAKNANAYSQPYPHLKVHSSHNHSNSTKNVHHSFHSQGDSFFTVEHKHSARKIIKLNHVNNLSNIQNMNKNMNNQINNSASFNNNLENNNLFKDIISKSKNNNNKIKNILTPKHPNISLNQKYPKPEPTLH